MTLSIANKTILKFRAGKFLVPVVVEPKGKRLFLHFPYNKNILQEVKSMQGAKWHGYEDPPIKAWSIPDTIRNRFQLEYLSGINVFERYDRPLDKITPNRDVARDYQIEFISHGLTRKQCILAGEMGTGKTFAAIEVMEKSGYTNWIWVGPRSALAAVKLDFMVWNAKIQPRFMTYERLRKEVEEGTIGIPDGIVFDESSKLKSPTSKRSQAASIITEEMRKANPDCFVLLMSGSPAPKSPLDWWHQCEVACPGFIKEGDINKFKHRLALVKEEQSITGGTYPKMVTWFDDSNKCKVCGKLRSEHDNSVESLVVESMGADHTFEPSVNEVHKLYERMQGLVLVKFKKDCLSLPERQFRKIILEPSESVKRAARLILANTTRTIQALILSRELSDGFQYQDVENGTKECDVCKGSKRTTEWFDPEAEDELAAISPEAIQSGRCIQKEIDCPTCNGTGEVPSYTRVAKEVPCPKEKLFTDLLDEHEGIGRFVTYAGFEASVDRCVRTALRFEWDVLRVDGRGWAYFKPGGEQLKLSQVDMLKKFQQSKDDSRICFIGQPAAAGMGLTLTASPSVFFYSNTFNGEDRIQAMDRIHRLGMDVNRGATIIDVVHLPIDQYVLDNINKKIDLQAMSMGSLRDAAKRIEEEGLTGERLDYEHNTD